MRGKKKKKVRLLLYYISTQYFNGPKVSSSRGAFKGCPDLWMENQFIKHATKPMLLKAFGLILSQ